MTRPGNAVDTWARATVAAWADRRDGLAGWRSFQREFLKSCSVSTAALAQSVNTRLSRIIQHASTSSPYYRSAWAEIDLSRDGMFTAADLSQLPFIDKATIKDHKADLVATNYSLDELLVSHTGGTTGTQTSFYLDSRCRIARVGRQRGILARLGYRSGMRRGMVWGVASDLLPKGALAAARGRIRAFGLSEEVLCCTIMNNSTMSDYYTRLRRFRPDVLYGYPTAISRFARYILESKLEPIAVTRTFVTAERLTEADRHLLQDVFRGEVYNLYCTREYGCVAFECERHQGLHVDMESSYVEIVRNDSVAGPGELGEIVVTDLNNYGMPLIRSRTGDLGAWAAGPCSCGLPFPLLQSLEGRATDSLMRPDGASIAGLMLTDLFMDQPGIRAAQFIQDHPSLVTVLIEATDLYNSAVELACMSEIRKLLGDDVAIVIKPVTSIPRNSISGKLQEVVCKVVR